jgi:Raf kinase inhibitor-like YbhB/YbcL family protein
MTSDQSTMTVTSDAFTDGGAIPRRFSCDGPGEVPSLSWSGTPAGTVAHAIVVDDPDAPSGTFTHWVVLDLPADLHGLTDGTLPSGAVQAKNSGGRAGWYPLCPPSGTHRYRFTVYALKRRTGLADNAPLDAALRAIGADAIASGRLSGTYSR